MQILRGTELNTITQVQITLESICNKFGIKGNYVKACRQKFTNDRTVKRLTEEETDDRDKTLCE